MYKLDEIEKTLLTTFNDVYSKNECKVLAFLLFYKNEFKTSRELEYAMDMRQPEASVALKSFIKKYKWLDIKYIHNTHNKGRPTIYFKLKVDISDIFNKSIVSLTNKTSEIKEKIVEIKKLEKLLREEKKDV